jgi:hypothetical protein
MGAGGNTPQNPTECESLAAEIEAFEGSPEIKAKLKLTYSRICDTGITWDVNTIDEVWKPVRGRCTAFRREQESCIDNPLSYSDPILNSDFYRNPDGKVFVRPLICDPAQNLVCTGKDFEVAPNTCVRKRERGVCYGGPWWDSTGCPRMQPVAPASGLTRNQLMLAVATAFTLNAGEISWAAQCKYWDVSTPGGQSTQRIRERVYAVTRALWPVNLLGPVPTQAAIHRLLPNVMSRGAQYCYDNENVPGSIIAKQLAELGMIASRPNQIWSWVHFLTFNLPNPVSFAQLEASRAIVNILLDAFWCDDCRGFFYGGIVAVYGNVPETTDPMKIAAYFNLAHNVASEHVASIRGAHPWIFQFGEPAVAKYQNPYFMTFDDALKTWKM